MGTHAVLAAPRIPAARRIAPAQFRDNRGLPSIRMRRTPGPEDCEPADGNGGRPRRVRAALPFVRPAGAPRGRATVRARTFSRCQTANVRCPLNLRAAAHFSFFISPSGSGAPASCVSGNRYALASPRSTVAICGRGPRFRFRHFLRNSSSELPAARPGAGGVPSLPGSAGDESARRGKLGSFCQTTAISSFTGNQQLMVVAKGPSNTLVSAAVP
jgi:hypothetical protein